MDGVYLDLKSAKIPSLKNYVIYAIYSNGLWTRNIQKFDNHDMALMLIDILYSRKLINEPTYRKILKKNKLAKET